MMSFVAAEGLELVAFCGRKMAVVSTYGLVEGKISS